MRREEERLLDCLLASIGLRPLTHLDVELHDRAGVPDAEAASHEDDLNHLGDLRVEHEEQRGVGEGASAHEPESSPV